MTLTLEAAFINNRIARQGADKSSGYRVIVFFNEYRAFFVYGFVKSDKDNITERWYFPSCFSGRLCSAWLRGLKQTGR
jgi:hypothetical protein